MASTRTGDGAKLDSVPTGDYLLGRVARPFRLVFPISEAGAPLVGGVNEIKGRATGPLVKKLSQQPNSHKRLTAEHRSYV
jgi:hypothetical protein